MAKGERLPPGSRQKDEGWSEIGRFFGGLPPHLFRQGLNLRNTLASRFAPSGAWPDILSAAGSYPWLTAHQWLIQDWQLDAGSGQGLLPAMFLTFAHTTLAQWQAGDHGVFDHSYTGLREKLHEATRLKLTAGIPPSSPFWSDYEQLHDVYTNAMSVGRDRHPPATLLAGRAKRLDLAKIGITAVLHLNNRSADRDRLWALFDRLNLAWTIYQELLTIRQDMLTGRPNYPIHKTMTRAGLAPGRQPAPEQLLGAIVLTGAVKDVCDEGLAHLAAAGKLAEALGLPTWSTFLAGLEEPLAGLKGLFSLKGLSDGSRPPALAPAVDPLAQAVDMAGRYLLDERTLAEGQEINRGGLAGVATVVGAAFPQGFQLYLLAASGRPLPEQIDELFHRLDRQNFRYYENLDIAPDTDELALLLRLFRYSQQSARQRQLLERPLRWLEKHRLSSGEIPVFWYNIDAPILERLLPWENRCLGAEINTLLGLIDYDWNRCRPIIERSAVGLFQRYLDRDFGDVAFYDALYVLWQALVLVQQLGAQKTTPPLSRQLAPVREKLQQRLQLENGRWPTSPQQTAFLILANLAAGNDQFLDPAWIRLLNKSQRYDGSWDDEPVYITCDRDGLPGNWYASRPLTTAFCYHALVKYHQWMQNS